MRTKKRSSYWIARVFISGVIVALAFQAVAAYTLVMKNGRRLEIPDGFLLTSQILTFETSPGIQVSVQLVSIDVAETERANSEVAGTFMKRINTAKTTGFQTQSVVGQGNPRTVTNLDLEAFRRVRVANEIAFERRRKELGLPTLDESRRQAETQLGETVEQVRQSLAGELEAEQYWRSRAAELRSEIAFTDAQIHFLRRRIDEIPLNGPLFITGSLPTGFVRNSVINPSTHTTMLPRLGVYSARDIRPQVTGRFNFGNTVNPGPVSRGRVPPRNGRSLSARFVGNVWGFPLGGYDNLDQRSVLQAQLDQLMMQRAGLQSRWRNFEDEARRSGVYPGWLRP